jgi:hypothetical protein
MTRLFRQLSWSKCTAALLNAIACFVIVRGGIAATPMAALLLFMALLILANGAVEAGANGGKPKVSAEGRHGDV